MSRREFSKAVKAAALKRATGTDGIPRCEDCGQPLKPGRFQYDHDKADGLGGKPTLENCKIRCSGSRASCHEIKTHEQDNPIMRKADAQREAHWGITRIKAKIPSRPKAPKRPSRQLPPRRQLYEDIAP